jgi:hypothetical protein
MGRAFLAQHLRLDSHVVEGVVSADMIRSNIRAALDAATALLLSPDHHCRRASERERSAVT